MTKSEIARNISEYVFILGASDPEMIAIEAAIRNIYAHYDCTPQIYHAAFVGADGTVARVHGGVAYKATTMIDATTNEVVELMSIDGLSGYGSDTVYEDMDGYRPVWVECYVAGGTIIHGDVCDHHKKGDPGYGKGPEKFWEASSIGQVYRLFQYVNWVPSEVVDEAFGEDRFLIAASDHCPGHAFAGKCPGVDIPALKAMRAANSAAFNKMDPETWIQVVDASIAKLQASPRGELAGHVYAIASEDIALGNHAQLISGLPMEYTMPGSPRDPRVKVGLLGGEPELVAAWMASKASQLTDIYGDPARGYAGGYLPS